MALKTKNIFLDTNIFEANNFFHSTSIQSLFYYSKIGYVNLYITSISKMELIERIRKGLLSVKEDHDKLVNLVNKTRILRNFSEYENI